MNFCKKIGLVFCCWFLTVGYAFAQNLVPNPSFETYTNCPNAASQIYYATPWMGPLNNSTDYFNACSPTRGVPRCGAYAYQYARTGNAYVGFWAIDGMGLNYREYAQVQLLNTLTAGKCYYIMFYTNLFNELDYGINNIAAHISGTSYGTSSPNGTVLNLTPHALKFGNPTITDTLNWVKVSGIYQASGGENHIIIGNFFDDAHTDTTTIRGGIYDGAYYYIDDVSVIPTDSISMPPNAGRDTTIAFGDSVFIGQQLYGLHCNWYSNSVLLDTNISGVWVKPNVTTNYIVEQNLCGNVGYDTVTVTVSPLGINELKNQELKIYPNPTKEILNVECENKNSEIKITDVFGNIIKQQKIVNDKTTINISDLKEGIYFIQLSNINAPIMKKLIVQH
jgi:hypothetical protein